MKINKNKIIAWLILAIVYFVPFRYAFLSDLNPGKQTILNLLAVVIGCAIFAILMSTAERKQ